MLINEKVVALCNGYKYWHIKLQEKMCIHEFVMIS